MGTQLGSGALDLSLVMFTFRLADLAGTRVICDAFHLEFAPSDASFAPDTHDLG